MESKPIRSKSSVRRIGVSLALLVVAMVVIVGLLWATNLFGWRKWRINEVQQFIGADIPADAHDVQFATDTQKTRLVWLRFTVAAETDVDTFVASLGLNTALRPGFTPFPAANPSEASLNWWTPFTAQTFSGLYAIQDGKTIEVLVDQTDAANPVVYLRAYTIGMG